MKVGVIGGGAAGMMAAIWAARNGHEVTVFEKNDRPGRKLFITGKGRCNLTNYCDVEEFMRQVPGNAQFLYSALYQLSPEDTVAFFESLGLKTKVERGRRVFPVSDKSQDVIDCMTREMKKQGVVLHFNEPVLDILTQDGCVCGIQTKKGHYKMDGVIIATGGLSYPGTGSTGDGYKFAKKLSHTVTGLSPSLSPMNVAEEWVKDLQGLSLKNVRITITGENKKVLFQEFGEMLFTHFGVSGPLILTASRFLTNIPKSNLSIDLKPALTHKQLDTRVLQDFEKYSHKNIQNAVKDLLPQTLIPVLLSRLAWGPEIKAYQITKAQRKDFVHLLKDFTMTLEKSVGFSQAVVTCGGVHVKEINPKTMASKKVENLYFAGEIIDVDALTGGYNLQIAFSTGALAGMSIGGGL